MGLVERQMPLARYFVWVGSVLLALLECRLPLTLDSLYAKACGTPDPRSEDEAEMTADERISLRAIVADFERLGIASRYTAC